MNLRVNCSAATSAVHLPFNFVYLQQLSSRSPISNSMTISSGTSVPTLFGFSHPISGLMRNLWLRPQAHALPALLFLGTSTAALFGTALNHTEPACCLRTAFRLRRQLFGTALNQLCVLPAHCLDTHFLARSLQLPLSFCANARAHTTNRALRTARPVHPVMGSTDRCCAQC